MGVGANLNMYDVVVEKFMFAISSPDEFLCMYVYVYASLQLVKAVIYVSLSERQFSFSGVCRSRQ